MVIFDQKPLASPLKKGRFWTKYKYSFKSSQSKQCIESNQCVFILPLRHFWVLLRDQGERKISQKMKWWRDLNKNFFVKALFSLENDSQGSFATHRDPYGHKGVKKSDFKIFVIFDQKAWANPLEKVDFGQNTNIILKASNRNSVSLNLPWDTFEAFQGTRGKEKSHKRWSHGEISTKISLSRLYLHLRMIPKGVLRHTEIPRDIKKVEKADFKIWSFLTKTRELTPSKKVHFWTEYKYSFKSFQSNICVVKLPLRHSWGLPRDQGERESSEKKKSRWELNRKFLVRALFQLKNDFQGSFATRRDP